MLPPPDSTANLSVPRHARVRSAALPEPRTRLIGRETALAATRQLLLSDDVGLLTLTGPPGVGKTRLALALATEVHSAFADGVHVVALAPVTDPALVAATIARALGMHDGGDRPPEDALRDVLQEQQMLLVLDNFEHLLPAAALVTDLLAACPRLTVLVTSRAALGLSGEHEFAVEPLAVPDPDRPLSPEALSEYAATALFIARTTAIQPESALTAAATTAVAAICRRLDGLPLAIELAAARTRALTPTAILARLERRLPLLTGGPRDLPARQRTLRDTIAWSYDLLEPGEQALFRCLAIFVGGCTLTAAEVVCVEAGEAEGGMDVVDGLAALVAKSLLEREPGPDGEPRFRMLETIREYGLDRLAASGEADEIRDRHAAFFLDLVEATAPPGRRFPRQEWPARLALEHDNLGGALAWSLSRPTGAETALRMAAALGGFWIARLRTQEGMGWLRGALTAPGRAPAWARGRALTSAAMLAWATGDYTSARRLSEESVALHETAGDPPGFANALDVLGNQLISLGDLAAARLVLDESIARWRQLGDPEGLAHALNTRALLARKEGDHTAARAFSEEQLALARAGGDGYGAAFALRQLGRIATSLDQLPAARALLEESLTFWRQQSDLWQTAMTLQDLAVLMLRSDDLPAVVGFFEDSVALSRELGSGRLLAQRLMSLGRVQQRAGAYPRAATCFHESLQLYQSLGDAPGVAAVVEAVGGLLGARGYPTAAARLWGFSQTLGARPFTWAVPVVPADHECDVAAARSHLGPTEFDAACQAGRALAQEQAVAEALAQLEALTAPAAARPQSGLTAREVEVLGLLADGLSNREIAAALVVSVRTAEHHIESIYAKTGAHRRADAAAYARRHGLAPANPAVEPTT